MSRCSTASSSPTTASPKASISCPTDPPASVGWKLVAVNLSDLAAKGATPRGALLSLTIAGDGRLGGAVPRRGRGGVRKLRAAADRRRHDRSAAGRAAGARDDRDRPRRAAHARSRRRPSRRCLVGGRHARRFGGRAGPAARRSQDREPAGRHLPPADPAARRRAAARAACPCHDGRVGRPAARRAADGGSERLHRANRPRRAAAVGAIHRFSRRADWQARLFAATAGDDYALLAALPAGLDPSTLSLPDGTTMARVGALAAGDPSHLGSSAAGSQSRCRRGWVLSIRAISIGQFPVRQWLIGLSGLLCGMTLALLIR